MDILGLLVALGVSVAFAVPFVFIVWRDSKKPQMPEWETTASTLIEANRNQRTLTRRVVLAIPALVVILAVPLIMVYGLIAMVF